jgi:cobalt-zinc-cadmium efflux system membrane fusion protein
LHALTISLLFVLITASAAWTSGEHHDHVPEDEHGEEAHREDEHGEDEHGEDEHGEDEHGGFSIRAFEDHGARLSTAGPGIVDAGIELPAEVRPNADRLAHIAPRFPGVVREVRKNIGDAVRAGDVLAVIESENLATYQLKAAFDGTIIAKHIAPGEAVDRQQPAYIVADLSTVWIRINVYQKVLPKVRLGQLVGIATRDHALEAEGTVSYLAPVVDQATRTAAARVVLPNPDGLWRPGLFVIATLALPVEAAVVVSRRALHTIDGKTVLFVAEGDVFVARPVTVGQVGRTQAEIVTGLAPGERFADEGSFLVKAELTKGTAEHHH